MTKQVRDWQKDMKRVEDFKYIQTLCNGIQPRIHGQLSELPEPAEYAPEYLLQQYAAEKVRADTLLGANQMYQVELAESLGREAKLREAIENALSWALNCGEYTVTEVIAILRGVLASLYPEEGEAK